MPHSQEYRQLWESDMLVRVKNFVKRTPLAIPYIFAKSKVTSPRAQNDEEVVLTRLLQRYDIPQTFIEFGFSGWEFNCAMLASTWHGLLVDGDRYNVVIAKVLWGSNITARQMWITDESIGQFHDWLNTRELGILSVDVDGNDFWFLRRLLPTRPHLIIVEYNSTFGLRPVTVPYDPEFDRVSKHPTRTYFGASLTALNHLCSNHGYSLIEVGNTGVNAFFVRNDLLGAEDLVLNPKHAFREKLHHDGSRPEAQWDRIKDMPFVDVLQEGLCSTVVTAPSNPC
jgi:hypothetical protein